MLLLKIQGLDFFSISDDIGACSIGSALQKGYDFKRHILDIPLILNRESPMTKLL